VHLTTATRQWFGYEGRKSASESVKRAAAPRGNGQTTGTCSRHVEGRRFAAGRFVQRIGSVSTMSGVHSRRTRLARGALALAAAAVRGEPVAVRHSEGIVHGFLALRTLDGATIADGDLIQRANGNRVTSRLTFRFRDGSLQEETTVFTQRGAFRLI